MNSRAVATPSCRGLASFALVAALLFVVTSHASGEGVALEEVARDYATSHNFHGTILVERRGVTLFHRSFGLADREFDIPVQDDTKFRIASITKAFTSVLILQLNEQGKLDLNAPFGTYLPRHSGPGAGAITIHHLLNHTSGLANYDTLLTDEEAGKKGLELYQLPHTTEQLLDELARGKPVNEPGKKFDYNNADYVILGKVIEALDGRPYEVVLADRILTPLGMSDSGMIHHGKITKKLARTYWRPKGSEELTNDWPMYPENWYAAGAMYSTATDLKKFADALFGGILLKPDSLDRMLKPGLDNYGYGAWVRGLDVGGKPDKVFERYGSIQGANSLLSHRMDADITVILLSNTNMTDLGEFSSRLGDAAASHAKD
ncbi:serine hydrolase domain-containing protein [Isosphaeraceae bacterium EP7]